MARASGKIILFGEHAVVYGQPALAAALDRGVTAEAKPTAEHADTLRIQPWNVTIRLPAEGPAQGDVQLARAFAEALAFRPANRSHVRVEALVAIPGGSGLGCSAALGVAVIRAIDEALGASRDVTSLLARTLEWERVFHGQPSGVDNAMAAAGGLALYVKGEPLVPVHPRDTLHVVVGDSGEPSATRATVEAVARMHARAMERTSQTMEAIGSIVRNGCIAIEQGDLRGLGQLLDMNQWLLSALMLSTPRLEAMCSAARSAGALGAKLTGGGGGGCMIALAPDAETAEAVRAALEGLGREAFCVTLAASTLGGNASGGGPSGGGRSGGGPSGGGPSGGGPSGGGPSGGGRSSGESTGRSPLGSGA
jgi:mevalonate kinase